MESDLQQDAIWSILEEDRSERMRRYLEEARTEKKAERLAELRPEIQIVGEQRALYTMRRNPDYDPSKEDGVDNRKYLYEPTHAISVPNDVAVACHDTLLLKQKCLRYYIALAVFLVYVMYFIYFAESMKGEWKGLESALTSARKMFNRLGGKKTDNPVT